MPYFPGPGKGSGGGSVDLSPYAKAAEVSATYAKKVGGTVNIMDYAHLAINDGQTTEDWEPAFRQAIKDVAPISSGIEDSNVVGKIICPLRRFKIRKPIMLPPQGIVIEGVSYSAVMPSNEYEWGLPNLIGCTVIEKTTNTTFGPKTRTARWGAVTDNFDVDAIFIIDHTNDDWNHNTHLKNLFLRGRPSTPVKYGIYAPRVAYGKFEGINMYKCETGYFTHDTYMSRFSDVKVRDAATGFKWSKDTTSNGTGTTNHFENCFADSCAIGYDFDRMNYSVLTGCGSDHSTSVCYRMTYCNGITFNGCGAEDLKENADIFLIDNSYVTVNSFNTYQLAPATAGLHSAINCNGNNVQAVFNACRFEDYSGTPNATYMKNYIVGTNSSVVFNSCVIPKNGGAPVVGTGSIVHTFDSSGYKQTTSTGTVTK